MDGINKANIEKFSNGMKRSRLFLSLFCAVMVAVSGIWPSTIILAQNTDKKDAALQEEKVQPPTPSMPPSPGEPRSAGSMGPNPQGPGMIPPQMPPESRPPQPVPQAQTASDQRSGAESLNELVKEEAGTETKSDRISLDLKGIDLLELFRILSMKMAVTIVPSKNVGGRVNIFLNNVSFKDAFDIVLISQDLAAERKGNIINVMTAQEYEKTYGKKYNEQRMVKNLRLNYAKPSTVFNVLGQIKSDIGKVIVDEATGTIILIDIPSKLQLMEDTVRELDQPLRTEVFDLKYAKSSDMKSQLSNVITTGAGELFVDERSGKVAVSDLPEKMTKIKKILKAFDSAPQQVFIEAEIVELTLNRDFERGINWQKIFSDEQWIKWMKLMGGMTLTGSFANASSVLAASYQRINVGLLTSKDHFNAVINFLEQYGDTKILSRPRIAAINNQEAKVLVGTRQAYVTATQSQSQATTVTSESIQFIDVGVKLNVVPTINTDGFITMKIKPEISSVSSTLTTRAGSVVPIVSTSEAETVIKIKDGTMIMIAGLMKESKADTINGIPFLSKIPWVGAAFSNRSVVTTKTELIVFLTPYIISGSSIVSGTEPEGNVPADLIDDSLKKSIISRKLDQINPAGVNTGQGLKAGQIPLAKQAPASDIEEKMKGLKKY